MKNLNQNGPSRLACAGLIWNDVCVAEQARGPAGEDWRPTHETGATPKRGARWRWGPLAVAAGTAALSALAFCAFGGAAAAASGHAPGTAVVVASFDFRQSELLAAIYALALMQAGIPARLQLGLGPRELVHSALVRGAVDVVPEYLGTALDSLEPPTVSRWPVTVLRPSAAQDQDGLVVTRATAARLGLRTISDLGPLAPRMILGRVSECPQRPSCLPALRRVYGLEFAGFVSPGTEQERVQALRDGAADVMVMGTASGYLTSDDLVLLADDRQSQPAGNIVPVVHSGALERHGARLASALDAVSARLTTGDLINLNWETTLAGHNVLAAARAWLEGQGILPQAG
jgi:osmoprotectant transport system substrate-binding protein